MPVTVRGSGRLRSWAAASGTSMSTRATVAGIAVIALLAIIVLGIAVREAHTTAARDGAPPEASGSPYAAPAASVAAGLLAADATSTSTAGVGSQASDDPAAIGSPISRAKFGAPAAPTNATSASGLNAQRSKVQPSPSARPTAPSQNPFGGRH